MIFTPFVKYFYATVFEPLTPNHINSVTVSTTFPLLLGQSQAGIPQIVSSRSAKAITA